jgi:succinate dehydrogenase / fumarate reductase flavoprotein subunit
VSVHGANRLGTNSLLDIIVFGRESGKRAAAYAKQVEFPALPAEPESRVRQQLQALRQGDGAEKAAVLRKEMQQVMMDEVGVFRTEQGMQRAVAKVKELQQRFRHVRADDPGMVFNTDLLEAWELGCMLDVAQVTAEAALARTESRGAHAREDFPKRDDENWLKHSLAYLENGGVRLGYKPVTITKWQPKARVY